LEAVQAVGLSLRTPLHQSCVDTAGLFALTQQHGRRRHIGNQLGAQRAAKIDVLTGWQAQRLLLERKASLVVSDRSGNQVTLASPGKIILSAGAVGSPTLLLRSGIGAPDSVAHNTRATLDLPAVGENLQDHLVYPVVYRAKQASGLPRRFGPEHRKAFRDHGSGPMASNIAEAGAFFSLDASADAPQFQLHFTPTHYLKYPLDGETDCCSIAVTPLHPKSRGRVSVHSEVNPNYLSAESDRAALSDAVDWTRKQVGPRLDHLLDREIMPGRRADRAGGLSKSCAAFAQSIYHPTSTCRMGKTPTDSVVNAQFELHGCADILIADASVLPDLPSGNTQAATFWAAERCAQSLIESSK
jgi:choline dehydrogenase